MFSIDFHPNVLQLKEHSEFPSPYNSSLSFDSQLIEGHTSHKNTEDKDWIVLGSLAMLKIGRNCHKKDIDKLPQIVLWNYNNEKIHSEWNLINRGVR